MPYFFSSKLAHYFDHPSQNTCFIWITLQKLKQYNITSMLCGRSQYDSVMAELQVAHQWAAECCVGQHSAVEGTIERTTRVERFLFTSCSVFNIVGGNEWRCDACQGLSSAGSCNVVVWRRRCECSHWKHNPLKFQLRHTHTVASVSACLRYAEHGTHLV